MLILPIILLFPQLLQSFLYNGKSCILRTTGLSKCRHLSPVTLLTVRRIVSCLWKHWYFGLRKKEKEKSREQGKKEQGTEVKTESKLMALRSKVFNIFILFDQFGKCFLYFANLAYFYSKCV